MKGVLETPKDPVKWPAYIFYFKPVIVLLNVVPFGLFLVLFARRLDRLALGDWTYFFCLTAAAFGTYLLPFTQTLNNHTVAAWSVFFAVYCFMRIWDDKAISPWRTAARVLRGLRRGQRITRVRSLPLLFFMLVIRYPRMTMLYFVPGDLIPIAAFAAAQYAVFGELRLAYEAFGSDEYLYEGSLWKTPLDLDAFNVHPEPYAVYFFHMTFGHHGVFSLTPIFLFSAWGAVRLIKAGGWIRSLLDPKSAPMVAVAYLTTVLTVVLLAFYTWNPKARNYGGSTQGLRWLFWMIPLWLLLLPKGIESGETRAGCVGCALCACGLGHVRGICDPQSLDPPVDPGCARTPGSVYADPVGSSGIPAPARGERREQAISRSIRRGPRACAGPPRVRGLAGCDCAGAAARWASRGL